jgi:hypothetical protein
VAFRQKVFQTSAEANRENVMGNYMKNILIILTVLIFTNCENKVDNKLIKQTKYCFLGCYQNQNVVDTMELMDIKPTDSMFDLLATHSFRFREQYHTIKMYCSDNHVPVDGGSLVYTLDSIGVIYGRSTTWPGFSKLTSDNDSINDLITTAFGTIMMQPSLRCFHCDDRYTYIPEDLSGLKIK